MGITNLVNICEELYINKCKKIKRTDSLEENLLKKIDMGKIRNFKWTYNHWTHSLIINQIKNLFDLYKTINKP